MIEPRVYRAAFLPAVIAFVLAMFSLESQPPAAEPDLAADVLFQGDAAGDTAEEIARQFPDRAPGSAGNADAAELVAAELDEQGFEVEVDEFSEAGRDLRNVVATRIGSERERIVVVAARDAPGAPDLAGSAADTAALIELAGALEGRAPEKTIVLASLDGTTLGDAGARRLAETVADRELIEAVLVLSGTGAGTADGPRLVAWSNDDSRGSLGLARTASETLRREFENVPAGPGGLRQFGHLALPVGVGAQGVLLDRGIEAIRLSGSGVLPPDPEASRLDRNRLGGLGRAVLGTISALDISGRLEHGPSSYVVLGRSVLPEWAVTVLALALILPPLVTSVDALARARRRRERIAGWVAWVVTRIVPFAIGLLVAIVLVLSGLAPNASGAAPAPSAEPVDGAAAALLGVVAAAVALGWIFLRPLLGRWGATPDDLTAPGAACTAALFSSTAALATWALNPWTALALVPAVHLWMVAMLAPAPARRRGRILLLAGGLLVPASLAAMYMLELALDPLEALWYLFLLVSGGQLGLAGALAACVLLGSLAAMVEIVVAGGDREDPVEETRPAVRGPAGYAGPGSLGGTGSALRR